MSSVPQPPLASIESFVVLAFLFDLVVLVARDHVLVFSSSFARVVLALILFPFAAAAVVVDVP